MELRWWVIDEGWALVLHSERPLVRRWALQDFSGSTVVRLVAALGNLKAKGCGGRTS